MCDELQFECSTLEACSKTRASRSKQWGRVAKKGKGQARNVAGDVQGERLVKVEGFKEF